MLQRRLRRCTGTTAGALVACFRGTEATNLLNWQTNITINMSCRDGLGGGPSAWQSPALQRVLRHAFRKHPRGCMVPCGCAPAVPDMGAQLHPACCRDCFCEWPGVHDGFYAALFHRPEGSRVCLFDELVDLLKDVGSDEEAGEQLPLFLTGHSLGGAIASVFAAALRAEASGQRLGLMAACGRNITTEVSSGAWFSHRIALELSDIVLRSRSWRGGWRESIRTVSRVSATQPSVTPSATRTATAPGGCAMPATSCRSCCPAGSGTGGQQYLGQLRHNSQGCCTADCWLSLVTLTCPTFC